MCRELYGQDDMMRPEVFSGIFQIAVMGADPETKEWFEDFAMHRLFCNRTLREVKQAAAIVYMTRDACISHRCEQNQVYRRNPKTGKTEHVCHPGRTCDTSNSQSTVGIVLAGLILLVLILLLMTAFWTLLRYTHIDRKHAL